ncbi:hypothetical protein EB75_05280 [Mycobacterium sp. ST-F2]|uniref:maleylpyruvate isomerase N-terminal domain-containing protein n=1 Tax=Mycobacteriaceae TaxID=1762 RepID=UPI00093CC44A|nr:MULTISPECIES: maleylpyruvate isomerase N-terminal domain-containing protein [Mycobacteriaceae]MDX1879241.1 TIGR03086 family protein [Mycolicibacterium sp. 141076]OKH84324.1 hypothetical protein EB75_05280 [Mycobacterium sp. ST-F2]
MAALTELTPADRHRAIAAGFTEHAAAVQDWSAPTPVTDWTAGDIVAHLVGWFTEFLSAGGVALPAGPAVTDDPLAAWTAHTAAVQGLLDSDAADGDFSHPMAGTHRLADAIDRFYTADVYMHTWDLATSNGRKSGLDPEFATHMLVGMVGIEDLLRSSGQYGPPVAVADDADPVTRLVGFIGRDPAWSARR